MPTEDPRSCANPPSLKPSKGKIYKPLQKLVQFLGFPLTFPVFCWMEKYILMTLVGWLGLIKEKYFDGTTDPKCLYF